MTAGCRLTVTTLSNEGVIELRVYPYPDTAAEAVRARVARLRFARHGYSRNGYTLVLEPTVSDHEVGIIETTLHFADATSPAPCGTLSPSIYNQGVMG